MKEFLAIFVARNKEFYRDKGSLSWSFIFPILIIIICAFAIANPDKTLFKVGTIGNQDEMTSLALMQQPFVEPIVFTDLDQALKRIQHHQLVVVKLTIIYNHISQHICGEEQHDIL